MLCVTPQEAQERTILKHSGVFTIRRWLRPCQYSARCKNVRETSVCRPNETQGQTCRMRDGRDHPERERWERSKDTKQSQWICLLCKAETQTAEVDRGLRVWEHLERLPFRDSGHLSFRRAAVLLGAEAHGLALIQGNFPDTRINFNHDVLLSARRRS